MLQNTYGFLAHGANLKCCNTHFFKHMFVWGGTEAFFSSFSAHMPSISGHLDTEEAKTL